MNRKSDHYLVTITSSARQKLLKDIYTRRQMEACGVLIGERGSGGEWHVTEIQPLNNIFASPVYFEFAPEELLEVELNYPDQIIGVYHSHPTGYARASSTDKQNMENVNVGQGIPWVWLIVCGPFTEEGERGEENKGPTFLGYYHEEKEGLQQVVISEIG